VNYRITEADGWVIVNPNGRAENNEPLRVRHLLRRWLSRDQPRVIINLCMLEQFGVQDADFVEITSRRGKVIAQCRVTEEIVAGTCSCRFTAA
jgi:anaerobic selenocysteine-containing dehydrogenase